MQIRTRLTLQFLLLGGIIMIIASVAIYYSSAKFRRDDFSNRLINKARSTARLFLESNDINANELRMIDKDNPANLQNERIIILDYVNDVVYSTDEKQEIEIRIDILERVRLGYTVAYKQEPYEVIVLLYYLNHDRFVVIAAANDIQGHKHLEKLRNILTVVFFLSLLLSFLAGWIYSGRALKPISNVIDKVNKISITSLNLRVDEGNGRDEIGRLAKTFNRMLERLETSFAMQKDFIANASHELRTPLTSINGQLDVLLMKDRTSDEYKSAIQSVFDDIQSLIDLSNRLLLIARTSAEGPMSFNKKIRIDEILWQAREEVTKFHSNYQVHINIDDAFTDADQMIVVGDEYLLKVAVSNIMDNACKYSPDQCVEVTLQHALKAVEVVFNDRGIGISETDLHKVFEPFYRGANTISISGSGIGLPLVKQIVNIHNGNIHIDSRINQGTRVTLLFPSNL